MLVAGPRPAPRRADRTRSRARSSRSRTAATIFSWRPQASIRPSTISKFLSRLSAQLLSHRNEIDAAGGDLSIIEPACKRFDELEGYLYSNIGSLTDYGRARREGERIATAHIETTVNQLINQRMCNTSPR